MGVLLLQDKTAVETLRDIERTLAESTTFECTFNCDGENQLKNRDLVLNSGVVLMKNQNLYSFMSKDHDFYCVFNREGSVSHKANDLRKSVLRPPELRKAVASNFIRLGGCLSQLGIEEGLTDKGEFLPKVRTIQIMDLAREPNSGDLGALSYSLPISGKEEPAIVTLWFNLKSLLPVKRRIELIGKEERLRVTEEYSCTINENIREERFTLQEEKK